MNHAQPIVVKYLLVGRDDLDAPIRVVFSTYLGFGREIDRQLCRLELARRSLWDAKTAARVDEAVKSTSFHRIAETRPVRFDRHRSRPGE